MAIEIRNASPDDYEAAVDVITTAFMERPDNRAVAESMRANWDPDRVWLAFDGDRVVGTFRSFPTEVTAPGLRRLPASAVSAVTVLPTHRRRGIMTALAAREHAALRERGEPVALLYAAEYGIYGRLGYAPATRQVEYTIDARATRLRGEPGGSAGEPDGSHGEPEGSHGELGGAVELVPAAPASRDASAAVFDAWRLRQPGEIRRRDSTWDRAFGLRDEPWGERWNGFVALHRAPSGAVDGYVRWKADPKWQQGLPMGVVEVNELHALTDTAEDDLLRFVLDLDLLATVRLPDRRESERFPWLLTNARAARVTDWVDGSGSGCSTCRVPWRHGPMREPGAWSSR